MRTFCLASGIFKRHKTIRRVIDDGGILKIDNYYSNGRCIWIVRTYSRFHDSCKGCALGRRTYCGYKCNVNLFASEEPDALPVHCKKVEEGDMLIGESGNKYIVRRNESGLFAKQLTD